MATTTLSMDPFGDDEILRAVMAAIEQLDPAKQHELLKGLQRDLQLGELADDSRPAKVKRAITALVEAAGLVEGPLSRDGYLALRAELPERRREWPDARSLMRWLGVSKWNDALRRARLEASADGDVVVRQLGPRYSLDELCEALRACAEEVGVPPSFDAYISWARRPDVMARPGRRPGSQSPFDRHGGFRAVLEEAGLIRLGDDSAARTSADSGIIRTAGYFLADEELRAALVEVAGRLGRPPRVTEYMTERQRIYDQTLAAGRPRAIPSYTTFHRRHGDMVWDEILMHYGLDPLGGRHTGKKTGPKGPTGEQLDRAEMLTVLREAWEAHDRKLTVAAYRRWRVEQTLRDRLAGVLRRIPDYTSYWSYFGTWEKALRAAINQDDDGDREAA